MSDRPTTDRAIGCGPVLVSGSRGWTRQNSDGANLLTCRPGARQQSFWAANAQLDDVLTTGDLRQTPFRLLRRDAARVGDLLPYAPPK